MSLKSYQVSMEIAGNTALWTRPDSGDSPCSYPAPTYSAVRGLFESVLWGPAVLVIPQKVELCSVPHYHSYATNYGGPLRKNDSIKKGNNYQLFATVLLMSAIGYMHMWFQIRISQIFRRVRINGIATRRHRGMPIRKCSIGVCFEVNLMQRCLWGGANLHHLILAHFVRAHRSVRSFPIFIFHPCCVECFKRDTAPNIRLFLIRIYVFNTECLNIRKGVIACDQ